MVAYLKYLLYWTRPEYARLLMYPRCLWFLEQLQNDNFREALKSPAFVNEMDGAVINSWLHYQKNRIREAREEQEAEEKQND